MREYVRNLFMQIFVYVVVACSYKAYDLHEQAKIFAACSCKIARYSLNLAYQRRKIAFMKSNTESFLN